MRDSKTNRRYRLHQLIKDRYRYSAQKKTIFIKWSDPVESDHVAELRDVFGYAVQTEIC